MPQNYVTTDIFKVKDGSGNSDEEKTTNTGTGEFADIFPAFKLVITVFLFFGYMHNYITENEGSDSDLETEYFQMLASYVIYANLFNTFCSVKMEKSWNKKLEICTFIFMKNSKIKVFAK